MVEVQPDPPGEAPLAAPRAWPCRRRPPWPTAWRRPGRRCAGPTRSCRRRAAARRPAPGRAASCPRARSTRRATRRRGAGPGRTCGSTAPLRRRAAARAPRSRRPAGGPPGRSEPTKRRTRWPVEATATTGSGVVEAEAGGRHRLEAVGADRLAAGLALAVDALVQLGEGPLDLVELGRQLGGQRHVLALLGGHLARVGEVVVEVGAGARCPAPARRAGPPGAPSPGSSSSWAEVSTDSGTPAGYRSATALGCAAR